MLLRDGKQISIRVFEPGHAPAVRRGPDSQAVLLKSLVALECNVLSGQLARGPCDVGNFPPQDGERRRREFNHLRDAQGDAIGVKDQGASVVADKSKPQNGFVETAGALRICRGYKSDQFTP